MEAVEKLVAAMRKASTEERETLKQQLLELATGASGPAVREAIENCRKGELLEVQWELDDVLEATAPKKAAPPKPPEAPKPEAPPDPNRPLSAKDLTLVYDDPRGLMIHKSKVGNRWFLTQVDPRSGQPQTMELMPQEVAQIQAQLAGSPYWVIGAGGPGAAAPAQPAHPTPPGSRPMPPRR
jgi:pyruvate/2-oxoglutarate dehydrogenase complex dihydrolipoamide acyltransferase (E2) component